MNFNSSNTRRSERPRLTIDTGALQRNWVKVGRAYSGKRVGAVLKSDAYGLGIERVAPVLASAGCREFWVATVEEGLALRRCLGSLAADQRIYLLHGLAGRSLTEHALLGMIPVLCSYEELETARTEAAKGRARRVAVQLDTGMTRLGLDAPQVMALAAAQRESDPYSGLGMLEVDAWITQLGHFNDPDAPECLAQLSLFAKLTALLPQAIRSIATSSTVFGDALWHFDSARVGSALYGVENVSKRVHGLESVATLCAQVLRVLEVPADTAVGYFGQYRTVGPATIATLAIGYGDGLPLAMGHRGHVILAGQGVPVIGEISMGLCSVDISSLAPGSVRAGDWAEVYGPRLPLHEQAERIAISPNALLVPTAKYAQHSYAATYPSADADIG